MREYVYRERVNRPSFSTKVRQKQAINNKKSISPPFPEVTVDYTVFFIFLFFYKNTPYKNNQAVFCPIINPRSLEGQGGGGSN